MGRPGELRQPPAFALAFRRDGRNQARRLHSGGLGGEYGREFVEVADEGLRSGFDLRALD